MLLLLRKKPAIEVKAGNKVCTIVVGVFLPLRKVTLRVLKSLSNNGSGICVGIAPSDIKPERE